MPILPPLEQDYSGRMTGMDFLLKKLRVEQDMKKIIVLNMISLMLIAPAAWATCPSPHANIQISKPNSLYIDNFDGTVTDQATSLVWAKCSLGQTWVDNTADDGSDDSCVGTATTYTWKGALDAARSSSDSAYLGKTGWRVPNVKELGSLLENACSSPAINTGTFPSTANAIYWTSSPYAGSPGTDLEAWYVGFLSSGEIFRELKSKLYRVRLVREGE